MPSITYISEIAGYPDAIFSEAANDPKIAPKKKPNADACVTAVLKATEKLALAGASALVRDDLQYAYDMYALTAGERPTDPALATLATEWDSGLDDEVENLFEPYQDVLSADWLAKNTIDTRTYEEDGVEKLAQSFAKEVWKTLTWQLGDDVTPGQGKSPLQILSATGITRNDVEQRFSDRIGPGAQATPQLPSEPDQQTGLAMVGTHLRAMRDAAGWRPLQIADELNNVLSGDDILVEGAAQRAGFSHDHVNIIQMLGVEQGDDAALRTLFTAMEGMELLDAPPPPPAVPPEQQGAGDGTDYSDTLVALREHGGGTADELAVAAGISRATLTNIIKGKAKWKPDTEAKARVRNLTVAHYNALAKALAQLDGDTYAEVS